MNWNVGSYDGLGGIVLGIFLVGLGAAALGGYVAPSSGTVGLVLGVGVVILGTVVFLTAQRPQTNVGGFDRLARTVFGPLLVVLSVATFQNYVTTGYGVLDVVLATVAIFVGAALVITTVTQACPINARLGMNTYE